MLCGERSRDQAGGCVLLRDGDQRAFDQADVAQGSRRWRRNSSSREGGEDWEDSAPRYKGASYPTQTSPSNYPGSCPQRAPTRDKATCVRSADLRCVVRGASAPASI
jgi:hypothetical protein